MNPSNIEIFFSGMISKLILKNKIIATIVYNLGKLISIQKEKIDKSLNNDI